MGRAKAAVLPLPVFAYPIQSLPGCTNDQIKNEYLNHFCMVLANLPLKIGGIQLICTGVGSLNPTAVICLTSHSLRPKDSNESDAMFVSSSPRGLKINNEW